VWEVIEGCKMAPLTWAPQQKLYPQVAKPGGAREELKNRGSGSRFWGLDPDFLFCWLYDPGGLSLSVFSSVVRAK
jgi:hypothetical protein